MAGKVKEILMVTRDKKNPDKAYWDRIGVAFVNKDGSLNLLFNRLPAHWPTEDRETSPCTIQVRDKIEKEEGGFE
jgi:hypothetical protein